MPDSCGFDFILGSKYFKTPSETTQAKSVASDLPNGPVWLAKNIATSGIYSLVWGCGGVFILLRNMIQTLAMEFNLYTSESELELWENSVGLPDTRIGPIPTNICERRTRVRDKLQKIPTVTLQEAQTRIDTWMPDYGIWLGSNEFVGENFRYTFAYPFDGLAGARERFVIKVNIPWIAIDQDDLNNSPLRWPELESWLRDFLPSYVRLDPVYWTQASICVITNPEQDQEIYADSDGAGGWEDRTIYWKEIDTDGTVVNHIDTETILPTTTQITRSFTDSTVTLITDIKDVTVATFL